MFDLALVEALLKSAACEAGANSYRLQKEGFDNYYKQGVVESAELFTSADLEAQRLVVDKLSTGFPEVAIIAEEQESHNITKLTFFTIDPIDGTLCFSRGGSGWGCALGFIADGSSVCGAIYAPGRSELAVARSGNGCFVNDVQVKFEGKGPKVVAIPLGPWSPPFMEESVIPALKSSGYSILEVNSVVEATLEFLMGRASLYIGAAEKIWDVGGAACMIEQAGGVCTDYTGKPLKWNSVFLPCLFARDREYLGDLLSAVDGVEIVF